MSVCSCPLLRLLDIEWPSETVRVAFQGVKLLFYNSAADVLLLDIPSTIPNSFDAFFVGEHHSSPLRSKGRDLLFLDCCNTFKSCLLCNTIDLFFSGTE